MRNNPVNNVDPDGHDCVYLNDTGNDAESVDNHSSPAECQATGGAWADGTITNVTTDPNSNNILIQTAQREDNGNIGYVTTETAPGQWSPGTELDQVAAGVNALRLNDFIATAAAGSAAVGGSAGGAFYALGSGTSSIALNLTAGIQTFATKQAARSALQQMALTAAQRAAALSAVSRATSTSTVQVMQQGGDLVVRIIRAGANGWQNVESIIDEAGSKQVVQKAFDAAGNLVHYDPK